MTRLSITTIALLLLLGHIASGQTTGSLAGTITDEYGKPVIGATVRLLGTSPARGAITRQNGSFLIPGIRAGVYSIQLTSIGYRVNIQSDIRISADTTVTVNACLVMEPVHMDIDTIHTLLLPTEESRSTSEPGESFNANRTRIQRADIPPPPRPARGVSCFNVRGGRATETSMRVQAIDLSSSGYKDIKRENFPCESPDIIIVSSGIAGDYMDTHPQCEDGVSSPDVPLQRFPLRLDPVIVTAQEPVVRPERVGKQTTICSCGHGTKTFRACGDSTESPVQEIQSIRPELR